MRARYVGALPLALGVRSTNVYEDRSIAVYEDRDDDDDDDDDEAVIRLHREESEVKVWGEYMVKNSFEISHPIHSFSMQSWHVRKQLSFDLWVSRLDSPVTSKPKTHICTVAMLSCLYVFASSGCVYGSNIVHAPVLICIFERGKMLDPSKATYINVFSIAFEVVSGYVSSLTA